MSLLHLKSEKKCKIKCRIWHPGAFQILSHAKSVSLWQQEFSKIVKHCNFDLTNYIRKYVKLHKMVKGKPCNNLGTLTTQNWTVTSKVLIRLKHGAFNFRYFRLFRKF